jgi:hypothetical protein
MSKYIKDLYRSIFTGGEYANPFEDTTDNLYDDLDDMEVTPYVPEDRAKRIEEFNQRMYREEEEMIDPVSKELEFEEQQRNPISPYAVRTVERLNLPEESYNTFIDFADKVASIESDRRTNAKNKNTSASGAFQFVKGSVLPALNRMSRFGELPEWASELKEAYEEGVDVKQHQKLITGLSYAQQRDMFLADITEKTVKESGYGDSLLKKIAQGDTSAAKELYYIGHHTDADDATKERATKFFG